MKRLLGQTLAVVVAGLLATALTPACAENNQSIFVRMAIAPPQNRQNNSCLYTDDPSQAFMSEGVLDVAVRDSYEAHLLVGSQLIGRGAANATRAEPNRIQLQGAVVRVTDPNGGAIAEFTSPSTAFLDPQDNNSASYSPFVLTGLDAATVSSLRDQIAPGQTRRVIANIKPFGTTLGGVEVEGGEFQFPITVCNRCLIDFSTGDDPTVPELDCSLPLETNATRPCDAGQDELVPCQICIGRQLPDGVFPCRGD